MYSKSYPRYYGDVWWQTIEDTRTEDFPGYTPFELIPLDIQKEVEYLATKNVLGFDPQ